MVHGPPRGEDPLASRGCVVVALDEGCCPRGSAGCPCRINLLRRPRRGGDCRVRAGGAAGHGRGVFTPVGGFWVVAVIAVLPGGPPARTCAPHRRRRTRLGLLRRWRRSSLGPPLVGDSRVVGLPPGGRRVVPTGNPRGAGRTRRTLGPPANHDLSGANPPLNHTPTRPPRGHPSRPGTRGCAAEIRNPAPSPTARCSDRANPPWNSVDPPGAVSTRSDLTGQHRANPATGQPSTSHATHVAGPQATPEADPRPTHSRQRSGRRPPPRSPHQPGTRGCAAEIRNPTPSPTARCSDRAERHPPTRAAPKAHRPRERTTHQHRAGQPPAPYRRPGAWGTGALNPAPRAGLPGHPPGDRAGHRHPRTNTPNDDDPSPRDTHTPRPPPAGAHPTHHRWLGFGRAVRAWAVGCVVRAPKRCVYVLWT